MAMPSKKLTQDEVDALIRSLDSDGSTASSKGVIAEKDVREFAFGSDDLSLLGD